MQTTQKLFQHVDWANQEILKALRNTEIKGKSLELFAHILLAERVWLTRLRGEDSSGLPIWAELDLGHCEELMEQNAKGFRAFLADPLLSDPERIVAYANSKGMLFENAVGDILAHVTLHGQYHRGQINLLLRENHFEPVSLDYIMFVR
ncbi:DinB family protein [Saccharibacillus sacchari]|uniref:DinB family protein n=1 Tax=Saccharibacillus sacchari TaxID=456493 RepID=A0ACC6PAN8_9BACL